MNNSMFPPNPYPEGSLEWGFEVDRREDAWREMYKQEERRRKEYEECDRNIDFLLFDAVLHSSPAEVVKFLAASCDPNAVKFDPTTDSMLHIFEYNMMQVAGTKDKKKMKKGVEICHILMTAGCRPPNMSPVVKGVLDAKLNWPTRYRSTKRKRKEAVDDMKTLGKTIPRLDELSRSAIHRQMRGITGNNTTYSLCQKLGPPNLTLLTQKFLTFE